MARTIYMKTDDPRHFNSKEECEAAAPYDGPFSPISFFEIVRTPTGKKFFAWGNGIFTAARERLKKTNHIDVQMPKTYAEWRALKAAAIAGKIR